MDKVRIKLYDLLLCISNAQDLVSTKLSNHHQQVAYLAFRLSEHINLPIEQQYDINLAALIHDIGALSSQEMFELVEAEPITVNNHAFRGARLLEGFKPLHNSASIIKFHHLPWNGGRGNSFMGEEVPFASHIIHLADRTCALVRPDRNIISQIPGIMSTIRKQANTVFHPDLVDALFEMSKKEYIWLDLISRHTPEIIANTGLFNIHALEIDDIVDLALVFSQIIDFRNRFTARHSAGVAKTAERLAQLSGFSSHECKMMLIAGYLHDLGKIAFAMTGWRIGYACGHPDLIAAMNKIHQYTIMCAPIMAQQAALEALRHGESEMRKMVENYNYRRKIILAGLREIGMECFEPQGAFYAFPSIALTGMNSEEFSEKLLMEEKVAVVPGSAFGRTGDDHVRCCYAASVNDIEQALERMGRFLARHRKG
jgi:response regulator RpfG family c-di-GMP phosphodiesterase